jgi:hypothetical protein
MKHKHHIIPKHMGGSDDPSNLIELTIEEHAEAHKTLWETHGKTEDYVAWKALSGNIDMVEKERKLLAAEGYRRFLKTDEGKQWIQKNLVGKDRTASLEAMRQANTGRPKTHEENQKNADAHKGKKHSPETIKKLSDIAKNRSVEHRQKIAKANTGKKRSQETIDKIAEANRRRWDTARNKQVGDHSFSESIKRGDPNE